MLDDRDLSPEQNKAIDRLYEYDETLLIAGVGFGKAIVALTAIESLLKESVLRRVVVFAPLKVCQLTWAKEGDKWGHINSEVALACGTPKERTAAVESGAPIVVCNFENIKWVVDKYGDHFDGVCFDEMSKLKAVGGASFKKLRQWVGRLSWRVGMSATPVAERGADIYGQALLLDLGKALGTRKVAFLNKYFRPEDYEQRNWVPLPYAEAQIAQALKNLLFVADDAGYVESLPVLETHVIDVDMGNIGRDIYRQMRKDSVIDVFDPPVIAETAAVCFGKCYQMAAGGLYDNDGRLVWTSMHKLFRLRDFIAEQTKPVIVVYQYGFERDWLSGQYPDAPILGGGAKFTIEMQDKWNNGDYPLLILHPKSAAAGLNLQMATDTMVFLSPVASADGWQQTIGRIRRRGSPFKTIHRYVFVCRDTVDADVLAKQDIKGANEASIMGAFGVS